MEIKPEKVQYELLLQTYPGAIKEIIREIKSKIEQYSKLNTQEELEKYGFNNGKEKNEFLPCIKDYIVLVNKDWVNPESLKKENYQNNLREAYNLIKKILKKYLDWTEEQYTIVSLWIIGTYNYDDFPTFPYLFLNAMKSSGKSRALNIITSLSYEGIVLNSLTEATMFRTKGTLGIDEFEGIERKGKESLRELLNSAYKKGCKIRRMKKIKTLIGEEQIVEEFEVYRPIVMANISGMESVLGDRCIPLVIEKSFNKKYTNLIEIFQYEDDFKKAKELLNQCRLCRCRFSGEYIEVYKLWNNTIITNNTNNINNTNSILPLQALKSLNLSSLTGRELELSFPLCMISIELSDDSEEILKETTLILTKIFSAKKGEDLVENTDISLIDFISQESEEKEKFYTYLTDILQNFQKFVGITEDWLNSKWMGRALKRLDLVIENRRCSRGREVRLNIKKAKEKIKNFK